MDWWVLKTGAVTFDALHAYGLGVLLAVASTQPVELHDRGTAYQLSCPLTEAPAASPAILESVLALPTLADLQTTQPEQRPVSLAVANLDGLLAALFTQRGMHVVSVVDLLQRHRRGFAVLEEGLTKARLATASWKTWAARSNHSRFSWLEAVLQAYRPEAMSIPAFRPARRGKDMSIWMTLDPSLGFSTRRPWSDGWITQKSNLTLSAPHAGVLLALIGAARFLRAQPVAGQTINYYLPLATSITLSPESALPLLPPSSTPSFQALSSHWLSYVCPVPPLVGSWRALAYQMFEPQGAKQVLLLQSGVLPFGWINAVILRVGYSLIHTWRSVLSQRQEDASYDISSLVSCLKKRREADWIDHLREHAWAVQRSSTETVRRYTFAECKEITMAMLSPSPSPLLSILERKQGTLRFGRALRLLGRVNHASLLDILELLESASTLEQMLPALRQAAQACDLASAKSKFILVPDEKDLKYLGEDVAQYGVRLVANLLMILSALRYPLAAKPGSDSDPMALAPATADDQGMERAPAVVPVEGEADDAAY